MAETRWVEAAEWTDVAASLKQDGWWLADLCGLDCIGLYATPRRAHGATSEQAGTVAGTGARFEAVAQMLHRETRQRLTIHVPAEGDPPTVPSIVDLWPSADFMEREAFDLVGIVFEGHPNLTRIMMPDEWEGHPLRKDYGVGKVPVTFIPQQLMQIDSPGQASRGRKAGRELDRLGQPKGAR